MPAKPLYPRDKEMGGYRWSSELFNKKIDSSPGAGRCWNWTGSTGPQGPLFGVRLVQPDGTDIARMTQARRILYAEYTGRALQPLQSVYHTCGNSSCMNPTHYTLIRPRPDLDVRRLSEYKLPRGLADDEDLTSGPGEAN